jgi:hypothetical protein
MPLRGPGSPRATASRLAAVRGWARRARAAVGRDRFYAIAHTAASVAAVPRRRRRARGVHGEGLPGGRAARRDATIATWRKKKTCGTRDSTVVPLRSTNRAWRGLASKFGMGFGACSCTMAACAGGGDPLAPCTRTEPVFVHYLVASFSCFITY